MHQNTIKLHELMRRNNLSSKTVAELTGRSGKTVRRWRSKSGEPIPDHMLELLTLKAGTKC